MLRARIMGQLTESPRPLPIVVEVWRMWGRAGQRAQLVSNLEFPHFKLSLQTRPERSGVLQLQLHHSALTCLHLPVSPG